MEKMRDRAIRVQHARAANTTDADDELFVNNLEDGDDDEEDGAAGVEGRGEGDEAQQTRRRGRENRTDTTVKTNALLTLGFGDLSIVVDGRQGDDVSMRPFTRPFTHDKIIQAWEKIGFVPFTRKCLKSNKVRLERGQTNNANEDLENLQINYDRRIEEAAEAGLNAGVFDASVPIAFQLNREKDKDDQVQQLVAQKGAFSASALWTFVGTRLGNASVVIQAQQEQLALNEAKTAAVLRT